MKKSAAEIISTQSNQISELVRGLGDIFLTLKYPDHQSLINDYDIVSEIIKSIKEKSKNKTK
jgi:hypothetical protein